MSKMIHIALPDAGRDYGLKRAYSVFRHREDQHPLEGTFAIGPFWSYQEAKDQADAMNNQVEQWSESER
jgi:hypothetical protein